MALVVLDGVGAGVCPDQAEYGDAGSDTLGNLARAVGGLELPNLARLGLGCARPIAGLHCDDPTAAHGVALPTSPGKDSTTGHWELCGLILERPFPTFPDGFPEELIDRFAAATGRGVLCNAAASGTAVLDRFGDEHLRSGRWIVYTSADSVFQVAAHTDVVPLAELYAACERARELLTGPLAVSRVIARPFTGTAGAYVRTSDRRDYSLPPPGATLLDQLGDAGVPRVGIGKVDDLFAGRGIDSRHTSTNAAAYRTIADALRDLDRGLVFANVVEFDQSWGHRNDVAGFYEGMKELDRILPELVALLRDDDLLVLTADHGNDPTTPSTDHSREAVPVLVAGPRVRPRLLGECRFADVGATIADYFTVPPLAGQSFLGAIV